MFLTTSTVQSSLSLKVLGPLGRNDWIYFYVLWLAVLGELAKIPRLRATGGAVQTTGVVRPAW